ncbi:hypothetical protein [Mesobacillus maritimus]|uniref:Uncharacterized protein n=1 Tax=Mesobacillus maritimus TaxID=1643336 RepID=A0ABS7K0W5_9BACI|nr:hypothetical protein [Mesobacillus maritimus]MBY0095890.1 hypothetical protein [Mesobacillus maritimus]
MENFPYFVRNLNPTLYVTQLHNLIKVQQQTFFYNNLQDRLYTNEEKTRILIEIKKLKSELQEIKASITSLKRSQREPLSDGPWSDTLNDLNQANQELIHSMEEDIRNSENGLHQLQLQFQKSDPTSLGSLLPNSEYGDSKTESSNLDKSNNDDFVVSVDESSSFTESSEEDEILFSGNESSSSDESSSGVLDVSDEESSSSIESSMEDETLLSGDESSSSDESSSGVLGVSDEESSSSIESSMEDETLLSGDESSSSDESSSGVLDVSDEESSSSIESSVEVGSIGHNVSVDDSPNSIEPYGVDETLLSSDESSSSGESNLVNHDITEQQPFSFIEPSIEDEQLSFLDEYSQVNKDVLHEEASSSQKISIHPIGSVSTNEKNGRYTINPLEDQSETSNENGVSGEKQEENPPFQNNIPLPVDFQADKQEVPQNRPVSTEDLEIKGNDNPELTQDSISSPDFYNLYVEATEEKLGFISLFKSLPSNYPVRSIITNGTEVYVSFFIHYDPDQQLVYFSDSENVITIECNEIDGITFANDVDCESYD